MPRICQGQKNGRQSTARDCPRKVKSNPYALTHDCLEKHGKRIVKDAPRTFEGLREYLRTHNIEGLVFWKDGEPQCKIKRSDFGFKWPDKTLRVEF